MELKEALVMVLVFLFPLLVYCLVLASLNRRPHPVVVSGPWDFLGMVLGLSGFLVAGGPAVLSNLTTGWDVLRRAPDGPAAVSPRQVLLGALLLVYFAVLVAGVVLALRRRRDVTSVYNVDPAAFDEAFGEVLDDLGYSWARAGNRFYLSARAPLPAAPGEPPAPAKPSEGGESVVVEVDPFPLMYHVSVRWGRLGPALRQELEGELARSLAEVPTRANPAGNWFLSAAATLFLLMAAVLLFLLAANVLLRG